MADGSKAAKGASPRKPTPNVPDNALTQHNALLKAADDARKVLRDTINVHGCKVLLAGCFAAGTKLLTREGWRAVETLREGDEVATRPEHDVYASVSFRPIEEVFVRTGRVLHLHLGDGQTIRTTPEHPFWVEELGWTPADMLRAGMRLATLGGEWVSVEEAYDTGEYETVYNCRVAEYHTYFVGDDSHVLAVWAHNRYSAVMTLLDKAFGGGQNERLNGLVLLDDLSRREHAARFTPADYAEELRSAVENLGLRSSAISEAKAALLHAKVTGGKFNTVEFVKELTEKFRWSPSDKPRLAKLENLWTLTRKPRAESLGRFAFEAELERVLHALGVLPPGTTLQSIFPSNTENTEFNQLYNVARQHGNAGRSPLVYWDPNAGNPYRAGTQYHGYYERIRTLATAGVPGAVQMFQSLGHPTQRYGIPFHLDRAEHYRQQETLVGIEVQTSAPGDKRGYVDLLLSGGVAIDCKAWTNFNSYSSGRQDDMRDGLVAAAKKYLGSANVNSLIYEFKGVIPAGIEDYVRSRVSVPTGKTLSFVAIL